MKHEKGYWRWFERFCVIFIVFLLKSLYEPLRASEGHMGFLGWRQEAGKLIMKGYWTAAACRHAGVTASLV